MVEHLTSKHKTLSLNPSTEKRGGGGRGGEIIKKMRL
jgi:hypothetical protein